MTDIGLNTIFYGPPGTGKTYQTVIYAVAIIENKPLAEVAQENYDAVFARYTGYKEKGRIAFTTFHQSYGYEEFIEGIRPVIASGDECDDKSELSYDVLPGIFKRFCGTAKFNENAGIDEYKINANPNLWKVSLCSAGDNPIRTECLHNGHIRIAWGDSYGEELLDTDFSKARGSKVLNAFLNRIQLGDIVVSCYDQYTIDAIGVVTGEPEWDGSFSSHKWLRKVRWIVKDIREDIQKIANGMGMTTASVYRLSIVTVDDILNIIKKYSPPQLAPAAEKGNYVFIIDEINRGNISKIFGELITLIEPAKRTGQKEAMEVVLPYSGERFGVPQNVYILGTMNTADRSIARIDTALRRRFHFKEMLPDPEVLRDVYVEDLSAGALLSRINRRIATLYDRDHTIGHAYFMALKLSPTIETLAKIFEDNILPVLQEYFYEDYEKIRLILGDNQKDSEDIQFILAKPNDYTALFGTADVGLDDGYRYEINKKAFGNLEAYRSI